MKKTILIFLITFVGINVFAQKETKIIAPQFEYTPNEEFLTIPTENEKVPKTGVIETPQFDRATNIESEVNPADIKPKKLTKTSQFEYTAPQKITTQTADPETLQSTIEWEKLSHDFGVIDYQKPVTGSFDFVNTTTVPVIVKDAKGSCGCTATDFPKHEILPGETARISATYDAENIGPFKKTVTVYTSADKDKEGTVLHFTGEVIWKL